MHSGQAGIDDIHVQFLVSASHGHPSQFPQSFKRFPQPAYPENNTYELQRFQGLKRTRGLEVDEDIIALRPSKRRRLRGNLTTSHLSKPSAEPAAFTPSRPAWRRGVWARQRTTSKDILRRAAIFNSIALKKRSSGMRGIDARHHAIQASRIE